MSYTNSTTNYGLPQWIAADHPKFLTDINNAFSTIDTQLKNANDNASTASDNATSALSIAGQAATTAESAATVAGQAAALAQSVNELVGTINAKLGTTSIATIGDGTVTGAISEINTDLEYLKNHDLINHIDISSYSSSSPFLVPNDGYVTVEVDGGISQRGILHVGNIVPIVIESSSSNSISSSIFVRKGSQVYCSKSGSYNTVCTYSPLT